MVRSDIGHLELVSIVMGVYNTNKDYLIPAIESILGQTYQKLEFIIVNDCSDEWCTEILKEYEGRDSRIVLVNNEVNCGITKTLNIGLSHCTGKYIARMDSDDISLPTRIERQVDYLEKHKDINVLSCCAAIYCEGDICYQGNRYHINPERITEDFSGIYRQFDQDRIRIKLSLGNIEFTHPTVMYRKSFLDDNGIRYDESIPKAQDYAMWSTVQEYRCMASLQEALFVYRSNEQAASAIASDEQVRCANITKFKNLCRLIEKPTEDEKKTYFNISEFDMPQETSCLVELLRKLVAQNREKRIYPENEYRQELYFRIFRKCFFSHEWELSKKVLLNKDFIKNVASIIPKMLISYLLDLVYKKRIVHGMRKKVIGVISDLKV